MLCGRSSRHLQGTGKFGPEGSSVALQACVQRAQSLKTCPTCPQHAQGPKRSSETNSSPPLCSHCGLRAPAKSACFFSVTARGTVMIFLGKDGYGCQDGRNEEACGRRSRALAQSGSGTIEQCVQGLKGMQVVELTSVKWHDKVWTYVEQ